MMKECLENFMITGQSMRNSKLPNKFVKIDGRTRTKRNGKKSSYLVKKDRKLWIVHIKDTSKKQSER